MNPETPDFKRLLLAVFLMTALLMGYNALFAPKPGSKVTPVKTEEAVTAPVQAPAPTKALEPEALLPLITRTLHEDGYDVTVSSEGAQITNLSLTGYQAPIVLTPHWLVESRDSSLNLSGKTRFNLVKSDNQEVVFQKVTREGISVTRRYDFGAKPFVIGQSLEFKNQGSAPQALSLNWVFETREAAVSKEEQLAASFRIADKHTRIPFADLAEKAQSFSGSPQYVGFDRRYFFMSFAPTSDIQFESLTAKTDTIDKDKSLEISLRVPTFILQPGASKIFTFDAYIGPKDSALLTEAGHGIVENIDYGWFGVLSRPLLWLLLKINGFVSNLGIAIILLTVFIKLLTFPLTNKSFKAQQQMKKIQPRLKELQTKYSHDKAMLAQQQMAFYKEEGINPMAGCLPILIQMPVWFALYQMLGNSVELFEQPFYGWISSLTQPDPYYVMPILMGVSMLASQWIMPPTIDDSQPQMKYVLWFMPLFLTFIMLNLPAGLSIYMLVNNLLTIAQQMYIKQRYEA